MRMKKIRFIFLVFCLLATPGISRAWGTLGHRITGEIAMSYLSKKAKKNIQALLGFDNLAMSSNWADFIKSDPAFNYLGPWHYINLDDNLDSTRFLQALHADTSANAFTKLQFLVRELKKPETPAETKKMYLRLVIHIVGDIHQPMHVSRAADQGGNRIGLLWFGDSTNLHRLWDDQLISFQQLSYTEYAQAINHAGKEEIRGIQAAPLETWFYESYRISQQLYSEIQAPYPRLSFRYNFDHVNTLNERLLRAGIRLAGLLNEIFA